MPNVSFIVAASQIGLELGLITKATGAALIAAGLLSVLIFPIIALTILRRSEKSEGHLMIYKTFVETERGPIARVTFSLPNGIWADTIYLVGDFNDWNYSSHPFQHGREEGWTLTVDLEVGRCYQFRYRRDGEWINDGQADGYVHNRYGSDNFLVVTDPKFKHYADDE